MASEGNLRYLQYFLLLGEGSRIPLKGLVNKEVLKRQTNLEAVLAENRPLLRNYIQGRVHFERIFIPNGQINTDMDTWDLALLCKVNLHVFGETITPAEKSAVRVIKDMRNDQMGHPSTMSLEENEFLSLWTELSSCLTTLCAGLSQDIQNQCKQFIEKLEKGLYSPEDVKRTIIKFAQYDEFFKKASEGFSQLEAGLCRATEKLDAGFVVVQEKIDQTEESIGNKIEELKRDVSDATFQLGKEARQSSSSIEEGIGDTRCQIGIVQNDVINIQEKISEIGENFVTKQEMAEVKHDLKTSIQDMYVQLRQHLMEGREFKSPQDFGVKVEVKGSTYEETKKAEDQLLKEFGKAKPSIKTKAKRAKQANDPTAIQELGTMVKQFTERIESDDVQIEDINKHCILLSIKCNTGAAMVELIDTLRSDEIREHVDMIAIVLTEHYGKQIKLATEINLESIQNAIEHLTQNVGIPVRRSFSLPIRCNTLAGLAHICQAVSSEETVSCLDAISAELSRQSAGKITIRASLNPDHIQRALENIDYKESKSTKEQTSESDIAIVSGSEGNKADNANQLKRNPRVSKSTQKTNISMQDDREVCSIYGCCCLLDGSILLADHNNKKLKRLNKGYEIVDSCVLPARPWDVCYAGDGEVATSLKNNSIQFVNIDGDMTLTRNVKFDHPCMGIAKTFDRLSIKGGASVLSYDSFGESKRILCREPSVEHVYQHVKTNQKGTKLYIAGGGEQAAVTVLDTDGKLLGAYTNEEQGSSDVCIDGEGNLFVCSEESKTVTQVDENTLQKVTDVTNISDAPWCCCYNKDKSSLIIGHLKKDTITVINLSH